MILYYGPVRKSSQLSEKRTSVFCVMWLNVLCWFQSHDSLINVCSGTSILCKLACGDAFGHFILLLCLLAVPQAMSMQRTTCCLLLRLSHATLPGKTNISGCCSSEARSCARWEWYITIVMPPQRVISERIHVVQHLGRRAYHLPAVCVLSVLGCLLFYHSLLFWLPQNSVSSLIESVEEPKFTFGKNACPEFSWNVICHL